MRSGALAAAIYDYINIGTGIVDFETSQFIRFLEFVKNINDNTVPVADIENINDDLTEAVQSGRQIMYPLLISTFRYSPTYIDMFGSDLEVKGFPNESRNGHVFHRFYNQLAIISSSQSKEAAWSFVRTVLTEEWQLEYVFGSFASNRAVFEQGADFVLQNAELYDMSDLSAELIQVHINRIFDMVNSASCSRDFDDTLLNIIIEDAENYFNDLISAEEAAKNIQSRVTIYLSERR